MVKKRSSAGGLRIQTRARNWKSAAARRLLDRAGSGESVEDAVARLADECLAGVRFPPTDLESVGEKLGITGIHAEDIAGSGELRKEGDGFRIVYSSYLPPASRRFTIAHELGHAILERLDSGPHRAGREVERLCDLFAVDLLMPRNAFMERAEGEISTQKIFDLAKHFRTSISATALRYADLFHISAFAYDEESGIIWGRGIVKAKGHVDTAFLPSIKAALNGENTSDEVFLDSNNSFQRWRIECQPFVPGKSVVCVVQPVRPTRRS
jgi:IrrE N-terminal-like domain